MWACLGLVDMVVWELSAGERESCPGDDDLKFGLFAGDADESVCNLDAMDERGFIIII